MPNDFVPMYVATEDLNMHIAMIVKSQKVLNVHSNYGFWSSKRMLMKHGPARSLSNLAVNVQVVDSARQVPGREHANMSMRQLLNQSLHQLLL